MKESKVLFKVAGYADAAKQQADAASVLLQGPASVGQAGEGFACDPPLTGRFWFIPGQLDACCPTPSRQCFQGSKVVL